MHAYHDSRVDRRGVKGVPLREMDTDPGESLVPVSMRSIAVRGGTLCASVLGVTVIPVVLFEPSVPAPLAAAESVLLVSCAYEIRARTTFSACCT